MSEDWQLLARALQLSSLDEVGLPEAIEAYAVLHRLKDLLKQREEALRPFLLDAAASLGELNDKGASVLVEESNRVVRERRLAHEPDNTKLVALLETYGVPVDECFDEVRVLALNPSKLARLIELGRLQEKEVQALRKETFALKVVPGAKLSASISKAFDEQPDPPKRR